ncbi:MAG: NDMA-dependent alcohol dehydrogenase [Acidimicrobiales bacterium]
MFTTRGAVLRAPGQPWEITEIEFDDPRQNELKVRLTASGLCHSDDHIRLGDIPSETYPMIGGHEGAGVVVEVGPDTPGWEVGDHLVMSFLPTCGKCRWCASGHQNLCDGGAMTLAGCRVDGTFRSRVDGQQAGQVAGISTFCETTVISVDSAVKVAGDIPLDKAALVGCGVCTGWGSAVNSAAVKPGHTTIVMGIGGIGANALQGARAAGATHVIAVDPVADKHELAQKLGATHTFGNMEDATAFAQSVTNGQGADSTIVTVGVLENRHVAQAFASVRKAGTVVVTGLGNVATSMVEVPAFELAMFQKRIQGSLFGESNPSIDIPWMLALYQSGQLDLDSLITTTYDLDQINDGYADMHAGKNIRGVIVY